MLNRLNTELEFDTNRRANKPFGATRAQRHRARPSGVAARGGAGGIACRGGVVGSPVRAGAVAAAATLRAPVPAAPRCRAGR